MIVAEDLPERVSHFVCFLLAECVNRVCVELLVHDDTVRSSATISDSGRRSLGVLLLSVESFCRDLHLLFLLTVCRMDFRVPCIPFDRSFVGC